ncbi:hypothetical protein [Methanocella sp. MCL-LM]
MPEKKPEEEKEEAAETDKKKRQRKKEIRNIEPAEEPVKGPMGEDIYKV